MVRTKSLMRKVTMVILTAVLAGRTGTPPPLCSGEQGRYSLRDRIDTPDFVQGDSFTWQVGRMSPHRRPACSEASAALGAPSQRFSQVRAPGDSSARTQAPKLVVLTVRSELLRLCILRLDGLVPR